MQILTRRRSRHDPHPTGLGGYDLGGKPSTTEPPVPALERQTAEQIAINDAGAGVFDTTGLLGSSTPIGYEDRTGAWVAAEQAQARVRKTLATLTSRAIAVLIATGRDSTAREPGVGLPGWRRRLELARDTEEKATQRVAEAERALVEHGGQIPATHGPGTLVRLLIAATWVTVAAVVFESALVQGAVYLVSRSESGWEAWSMAALILIGTVGIPHLVATGLRTIRHRGGGRWLWWAIIFGVLVWGTLVVGTADLRNGAAHTSISTTESDKTAVQVVDGGALAPETAGVGTAGDGSFKDESVVPNLFPIFLSMMLAMSTFVFLRAFTSHSGEQIEYVRARRAQDVVRATAVDTESAVDEFEARLGFQTEDTLAGEVAAESYIVDVLPTLGALVVEDYIGQLCRSVGDAGFTDAVRALPSRLSAEDQALRLAASPIGGGR